MKKSNIDRLVAECRAQFGDARVEDHLRHLLGNSVDDSKTLTILANSGIHHFPDELKRGEVFVVSEGSFDFSTAQAISRAYTTVLERLAAKLRSDAWTRIYLVPFGHGTLSMQIKLLVYRITRIETIDVVYTGDGRYLDLALEHRGIILASKVE